MPRPYKRIVTSAEAIRACLFIAKHAEHEGIELGALRCVDIIAGLRDETLQKIKRRALADLEKRKPWMPGPGRHR